MILMSLFIAKHVTLIILLIYFFKNENITTILK